MSDTDTAATAELPTGAGAPHATTAVNPQPAPPATDHTAIIEGWWRDTFPGSIVARSEEHWNFVFGAVDDLKKRLKEA